MKRFQQAVAPTPVGFFLCRPGESTPGLFHRETVVALGRKRSMMMMRTSLKAIFSLAPQHKLTTNWNNSQRPSRT